MCAFSCLSIPRTPLAHAVNHMPKHLKFGGGYNTQNLLRVHFEFESFDDPPRCVIGHVGEHLPNTML